MFLCIFQSSLKISSSYSSIAFFTSVPRLELDEQMGDEGLDDQTTEVKTSGLTSECDMQQAYDTESDPEIELGLIQIKVIRGIHRVFGLRYLYWI